MSCFKRIIATTVLACASAASAAPGDLDTDFGTAGVASAGVEGRFTALALEASGDIVAAGYTGGFVNGDFFLARFDATGAAGISTGSSFVVNPGNGDNAQAIVVDGSGRLLLVGSVNGRNSDAEIGLARYDASGALDATFDGDGLFEFDIGTDDRAYDAVVDGSGNIVLVGSSAGAGRIARVTDAGALDASFDTDGIANVTGVSAHAVAIDGSGRILVASNSSVVGGSDIFVSRFNPSGALDGTFGAGGIATIDLGGKEQAFALAIDGTGRIIVAGSSGQNSTADFLVARLTDAGALDASFNATGTNVVSVTNGADIAYGVDLTSDGAIVAGGSAGGNTGVIKLLDNGTLDTSFGAAGVVDLDQITQALDAGFDLLVDAEDRILVAGHAHSTDLGGYDMTVVRLQGGSTTDLSITKDNGAVEVAAGSSAVYTIVAANAGPSPVTGATVTDTFPAVCDSVSWSCVAAGGATCTAGPVAGDISDVIDLPVSASATYTATCEVNASASGTIDNTATIAAPAAVTDIDLTNNSASDSDPIVTAADLAISKTNGGVASVPGTNTVYTIVASNPAGPSNIVGATVTDTFPAACASVSWSCVAAGGATCTAGPSAGDINDVINLPVGGTATYTATCSIDAGAMGTLDNTATIAVPGGASDPTPGNNSATDSDTLGASANLAISKTNGVVASVPGTDTVYTIVASNPAGPSDIVGATVTDTFPAACASSSWTCVAAGGATCTAGSVVGDINDVINLPIGGTATYTATCSIDTGAVGTLDNTATVALPGGAGDPVPGNNSATDSDTLGGSADLSTSKQAVSVPSPLLLGSTIQYQLDVSNAGPSTATDTVLTDVLPDNLTYVDNDCGATFSGSELSWAIGSLSPGSSQTCLVDVVVASPGPIVNTAVVSSSAPDPIADNGSSTSVLAGVAFVVTTLSWQALALMLMLMTILGGVFVRRWHS
jgi:uncharacterized delta-60 repeat protein/uncharacterized repeat protein (TIGR01451 family)